MHKWGMTFMVICEFGAQEQKAEYVLTSCFIYHHPNGACSLRCQQEPGDVADGNMPSHLVDHTVPVHLPQTKKKQI